MQIDLKTVSAGLQSFTSKQGQNVLGELSRTLDEFRQQISVKLNDAEFNYLMQTLLQQQKIEDPGSPTAMVDVGGGFQIRNTGTSPKI